MAKEGGWKGPKYNINTDPECFELATMEQAMKNVQPGMDYANFKLYNERILEEKL